MAPFPGYPEETHRFEPIKSPGLECTEEVGHLLTCSPHHLITCSLYHLLTSSPAHMATPSPGLTTCPPGHPLTWSPGHQVEGADSFPGCSPGEEWREGEEGEVEEVGEGEATLADTSNLSIDQDMEDASGLDMDQTT